MFLIVYILFFYSNFTCTKFLFLFFPSDFLRSVTELKRIWLYIYEFFPIFSLFYYSFRRLITCVTFKLYVIYLTNKQIKYKKGIIIRFFALCYNNVFFLFFFKFYFVRYVLFLLYIFFSVKRLLWNHFRLTKVRLYLIVWNFFSVAVKASELRWNIF